MARMSLIVAALLMLASVSLVTSRYQSRQLFIELGRQQAQARDLDTDWRRLQLERAELARNARVDRAAREELKMIPAVPDRTIYLNQAPIVQPAPAAGGAQ
ncbi:cell division protein FtsL [Bordetella genomosp. 13]|uniref:Cell division protein FtsL n=1 Tax=Bordetella genomosp. 13 TaxID=463040 RepID=A0A1W6ZGL9_9BORD|nr:cell division protein FtsL [Bordetella genomosp. 13]ARP96447.1 cell division protein FtsL [Bordetella genomosp. 13]